MFRDRWFYCKWEKIICISRCVYFCLFVHRCLCAFAYSLAGERARAIMLRLNANPESVVIRLSERHFNGLNKETELEMKNYERGNPRPILSAHPLENGRWGT